MSGGAGTTKGTTFQENVAAWLACLILAEDSAPSILGLPSDVTLLRLDAETQYPVDDLKVETSADGQLFFQCKASLSFSDNGRFRSVIEQFVRQYHEGYVSNKESRRLDLDRDRLVLAVGHDAPATIRDELRKLLARLRTCGSYRDLKNLRPRLSKKERNDLGLVEELVRESLSALNASGCRDEDVLNVLRLMHVLPLDFGGNGETRREADRLLRTTVLKDPQMANQAWDCLVGIVRELAPNRTGADRRFLSRRLEDRGLISRPARSALGAIDTLKQRSAVFERHLSLRSQITFRGKAIKIRRPVVQQLLQAAQGDVLVVGEAGAGKSGCLYDTANAFHEQEGDVIVLAVDQLAATSFGELDVELRLPDARCLVDVLADWSGSRPAVLIIDALDAARTTHGLNTLCSLIEQIRRYAKRWRVVASVREYDLAHSRDIQRLFRGEPVSDVANDKFKSVRHLRVPLLTDEELDLFAQQAPEVAEVRNRCGRELQELTRNLFNLQLLVELVESNVDHQRLSEIKTQVGLLDLYWAERVEKNDTDGSLKTAIKECVHLMVDGRSLNLSEEQCSQRVDSWDQCIRTLGSLGILRASDAVVPGAARSITFSHTILFDYAAARLLLMDLPDDVIDWLGNKGSQDLLVAIRPSLTLAFERLWHAKPDRKVFWDRAICFAKHPFVRPIGQIIPADVAAREYRRLPDMMPLLDRFSTSDKEVATKLLHFVWQAALARHRADPHGFPLCGECAPEWLALAEQLAERHLDETVGILRSLFASVMPR
ncbi:hypothetical protein JCM19992_19400 [Thermostilla marina]